MNDKIKHAVAIVAVAIALVCSSTRAAASPVEVVYEDFEDAVLTYTSSVPDDLSDIGSLDYFGRISPSTAVPSSAVAFTNQQGSGYYGVFDSDGTPSGDVHVITLSFLGLDIAGLDGLSFSLDLAEDDDGANQDWDDDSSVIVWYQIDDGGYDRLFAIRARAGIDTEPRVDSDFDGLGDGAAVTDAFTTFSTDVAGTGDKLDVQIVIRNLVASNEDVAIDNVRVTGAAPEPGSLALLGVGGLLIARRRHG